MAKNIRLPFLIWVIFLSTILALSGGRLFGFNLSGWAWGIPLLFSVLRIPMNVSRIRFPVLIWLPWILVVIGYLLFSEYSALQRSVQVLCPIVIGMGVSTYRLDDREIDGFLRLCKYLAVALIMTAILKAGVIITGAVPEVTGLAPEVMTGILLCTIFVVGYVMGRKRDFAWWLGVSVIPFVAVTRTAIVATGLTLPMTFAPMKLIKRLLLVVAIGVVGLILFYSPRIQHKSFRSGEGEISDVLSEDFRDSGRFFMWDRMEDRIKLRPWFGYGVGAGEQFVRAITMGFSGYPHNDYLLTLYDYGIFGITTYGVCLIMAAVHAYNKSRMTRGGSSLLFLIGASAFIPYAIMMYTDNIMVYVSFFGNLQFAIIGLAYGSLSEARSAERSPIRVKW
jgi:O-antigen ligase